MITTQYGNEVKIVGVQHSGGSDEIIICQRVCDAAIREYQRWQLRATDGANEIQTAISEVQANEHTIQKL